MPKFSGCLMAALLASALAMPANAAQQIGHGGSGGHAAPARAAGGGGHSLGGGGGGHSFSRLGVGGGGHTAIRSFTPHVGGRTFTPRVGGRSANFATVHRGTTFNRSVLRSQRLNRLAQPNSTIRTLRNTTAVQTNAQRSLRRNGTAGITTQAARQGRFASRFAARTGNASFANIAAHRAWRRGLRAGFVGWYGPVFWPYAYSDIFDYAFWPYGYDDGYWDYAYDNFIDGLFWGEAGPPDDYAYAGPAAPRTLRVSYAGVQELCKQPGTGITAWPYAEIKRKVGLNADQKQLLDGVRKAGSDAAVTFKASCPAENMFPLTPPGRLTAMTGRLQATLDAVTIVQPALDKFYNSLSDEQKERFNAIGPKRPTSNPETAAALPQDSKSCSEVKPGLADLGSQRAAQHGVFKQLHDATGKAVSLLQAACPEDVPLTLPGRLAAMEKWLQAMVEAAKTVKPALDGFYASLSNEQKARFDRIGQQLAQPAG